jgi:hypothetical protein
MRSVKIKWNLLMSIKTWYTLTCNPERIGHVEQVWTNNMICQHVIG